MRVAVCLVLGVGCGRVGFDPIGVVGNDASGGGDVRDGAEPSGLLLHYEFEPGELVSDRVSGRVATCGSVPDPCPTLTTASRGSVGLFDGNQCMFIDDAPELRPTQFTLSAWFMMNPNQGGGGALFQRPRDGLNTSDEAIEVYVNVNSTSWGINQMFVNEPAVSAGVWHHYAGVFDGNTATLYVDATVLGAQPVGPVNYVVGDTFQIGCDFDFGSDLDWWEGQLDSIRFYDRALSLVEIQELMLL